MHNQFHNLKNLIIAAVLLFAVVSCSDSNTGSDSDDDLLAAMQGVWQLSSEDGDVSFVHIDDKVVSNYDFLGDDFDEGPECYLFTESTIITIDGDEVTFEEDGVQLTTRVSVNNNVLSVKYNFGNIEFTELFNKSNSNVGSFEPLCDDDFEF